MSYSLKLKNKILFIFLTCFSCFVHLEASAGGSGTGGGRPRENVIAEIRALLQGDGLKSAMLNYLKTILVNDITDISTRATFQRILANGALQRDILIPGNYQERSDCKDAYDESVSASARIGDVGGIICFDVDKLADEYKDVSSEEEMIRLASLAFHEHVHHFQTDSSQKEANENEAYALSAYVKVTAKIAQMPVLEWSPKVSEPPVADNPELSVTRSYEATRNAHPSERIRVVVHEDRPARYKNPHTRYYVQDSQGVWTKYDFYKCRVRGLCVGVDSRANEMDIMESNFAVATDPINGRKCHIGYRTVVWFKGLIDPMALIKGGITGNLSADDPDAFSQVLPDELNILPQCQDPPPQNSAYAG